MKFDYGSPDKRLYLTLHQAYFKNFSLLAIVYQEQLRSVQFGLPRMSEQKRKMVRRQREDNH